MKILVFTHLSNFSGGANRSLLSILEGLKKAGHKIEVVLPRKAGELNTALTKVGIPWIYCRYYRMGAKRNKGIAKLISYTILYGKLLHHYFASKCVLRKIHDEKYDIVYTNTILPYIGLFVSQSLHIPNVIHDRESLISDKIVQIKNFDKFLYKHANKIIVISNDLKQQWEKKGYKNNIVLVSNGIPIQHVVRAKQDNIEDGFNILMTAQIASMKHHLDALEALTILKDRNFNDIYLIFAGSEGDKVDRMYRKQLDQFISDKKLGNNVRFLGEIENMGMLRSKMHVELMCNPTEPFGRVTVEGMRSGLVVIGVKSGGTLDIINDNKNGLFYKKGNILDLVNKIEKVYSNKEMRMRIADYAFKYSKHHFTIQANVNHVEKVLLNAIHKYQEN